MAERTMRVCDRCGRLPADPIKVSVLSPESNGLVTSVDLCGRCLDTLVNAIKRTIKAKETDNAID